MRFATDDALARLAGARAVARLREGWGDRDAWRVLREETVRAWSELPEVGSAVIVVRGLAAEDLPGEETAADWLVGSAASGRAAWVSPAPAGDALWRRVDAAAGEVAEGAPNELPAAFLPEGCRRWLAVGAPQQAPVELALLVGIVTPQRPEAGLRAALLATARELAAFLGLRRRQVETESQLAAARAEAEALGRLERLRGRLAAVTAHELRTPLASITAYTDVLLERSDEPGFAKGAEFLRIVRDEADRLDRLVDQLLDFSRRHPGLPVMRRQPCDVPALLLDAARLLAPQAARRGQTVVCRTAAQLPPVEGDADLLRQVFINLLGNALKFSAAGSRVAVLAREDAALVRVAVVDRGPGIAPDELRAIFRSFYRAGATQDVAGSGLGLSIVKDIVDLHEGHVDVRSQPGRGSAFSVLLPKVHHHQRHLDPFTAAGADPGRVETVCGHGLRLAAELTGAGASAVCLLDGDDSTVVPTASQGLPVPELGRRLDLAPTLLADVVARRQVLLSPPDGDDLPWPAPGAAGRRARGWIAAPLVAHGRAVGVVLVAGPPRRTGFTADEAAMLRVVGETLGAALAAAGRAGATEAIVTAVAESLRFLGGMRRGRIPTADPLALRLLAGTATALGLTPDAARSLQFAGALHDVGMLDIDPDIVQKAARLSVDEMDEIVRHPRRGLDLLGPLISRPDLREVILHHHERVDGSGYPGSRRGDDIPLGARILAVVDAFFAMARHRPYRERRSPRDVVAEIRRHAGTQFDAAVVEAFVGVLSREGLLDDAPRPEPATTPEGG